MTVIDLDSDLMVSTGDVTTFDSAAVSVSSSIDGSMIATAELDGTCAVGPGLAAIRDVCQLNFDFGTLGTISAQGPIQKMTIAGGTGCFSMLYGLINGSVLDQEFAFTVDAFAR